MELTLHEDLHHIIRSGTFELIALNQNVAFIERADKCYINWVVWPSEFELKFVLEELSCQNINMFIYTILLKETCAKLNNINVEQLVGFYEFENDLKLIKPFSLDIRDCSDLSVIKLINQQEKIDLLHYSLLKESKQLLSIVPSPIKVGFLHHSPVGVAVIHGATTDRAWLRRLFVRPQYRNLGFSYDLINYSLMVAKERQFESVSALVENTMWLRKIYEKTGFRIKNETVLCRIKM